MMKSYFTRIVAVLALAVACQSAYASLTIVSSVGGQPFSGRNYVNFDDLAVGGAGGATAVRDGVGTLLGNINLNLITNAQVVTLPNTSQYAAPFISNSNGVLFGDNTVSGQNQTQYVTSGSTGSAALAEAELDFSSFGGQKYLGLLWGSVDTYNSLTFEFTDGTFQTITGSQITPTATGNQGINGTFYVNIDSTKAFSKVVATSSSFAFEFDNVAFSANRIIPEASTMAVWSILSLCGLAVYRRWNKV